MTAFDVTPIRRSALPSIDGLRRSDDVKVPVVVGAGRHDCRWAAARQWLGSVCECAHDLDDLLHIVQRLPPGIVLLRPEAFAGPAEFQDRFRWQWLGWTMVLWFEIDARGVAAALAWLELSALPILPDLSERSEQMWARFVDESRSLQQSCRVLPFLANRLRHASPLFAANALAVYGSPSPPNLLKQLAANCGVSERHCRRLLSEAGIESSHLFFSGSRVLRAYHDVITRRETLVTTARKHGFGTARTLRQQWREVTGKSIATSADASPSDTQVLGIALRCLGPSRPGWPLISASSSS